MLIKQVMRPLTYDCEVKDLVFLYKSLLGHIDIDISFIKRVSHGRTQRARSSDLKYLETPFSKSVADQSSFFNYSIKLWNQINYVLLFTLVPF